MLGMVINPFVGCIISIVIMDSQYGFKTIDDIACFDLSTSELYEYVCIYAPRIYEYLCICESKSGNLRQKDLSQETARVKSGNCEERVKSENTKTRKNTLNL